MASWGRCNFCRALARENSVARDLLGAAEGGLDEVLATTPRASACSSDVAF